MMMTDEWITIIEQAEQLSEMLLSSEMVADYRRAHDTVYSDVELGKSIKEFTTMKERYEEVQRFGRYHPDYHIVMKSIRVQKRELDVNEQVAALRLAENDVQEMLDEIGSIIAKSVSPAVKVPAGSAFFTSDSSCGGSCGTGSSCSCSA
ncbi:YlbF family regulator [Sporosarcina sp. FSL K6-1522]|uniref:YlbF family regulator n=1 Tax=Sporosarcina sp. FSL K6-1522 TaxID=2921554 RepID=UPI00315A68FE